MERFMKALDRNGPAFSFLYEKFPRFSLEKIKVGLFIGPSVWSHSQWWWEGSLECLLAWCDWFSRKCKSCQLQYLVEDLTTSYKKLGCNMSLKMCFLHSLLDSILVNCGTVSDERGECFHQDISVIENRYRGKWSATRLADYWWTVKRDAPEIQYRRQVERCLV